MNTVSSNLEKKRDELIEAIEKLEEEFDRGRMSKNEYSKKRRELERQIVDIMDLLVQMQQSDS